MKEIEGWRDRETARRSRLASSRLPIAGAASLSVIFICFTFVLAIAFLIELATANSLAQNRRNGAHSIVAPETFTAADRTLVDRAVGATCSERVRDPFGSMPIDEMQARPSLNVNNPSAVAGA